MEQSDLLERLNRLLAAAGVHTSVRRADVRVAHYRPRLPLWPEGLKLRIAVLSDFHFADPSFDAEALSKLSRLSKGLRRTWCCSWAISRTAPASASPGRRRPGPTSWPSSSPRRSGSMRSSAITIIRRASQDAPGDVAAARAQSPGGSGNSVLVNRATRLSWRGQGVWLAGLGDQLALHEDGGSLANLPALLRQVSDEAPILLLAHEPDIFPEVPERVALTLAGHLHSGQVRFFGYAPVVPSAYGQQYLHGHVVENRRHMIINGGLGFSGLPIRFGAPPEIALIELGDAS